MDAFLSDEMPRSFPMALSKLQGRTLQPSTAENESIPSLKRPSPTHRDQEALHTFDPLLAITPEKSNGANRRQIPQETQSIGLETWPQIVIDREPSKVRFHSIVQVQDMSSDLSVDPEDSTTINEDISFDEIEGPSLVEDSSDDESTIISTGSEQSDKENRTCGDVEQLRQKMDKMAFKKEILPASESASLKSRPPISHTEPQENALARPEFNSTLRVGQKLMKLQAKDIDISKAVSKRLKESKDLREKITEKVCSKVNIEEPLFSNLVSLEVKEHDLEEKAILGVSSKIPAAAKSSQAQQPQVAAPDIMEFFSTSLQHESPSFNLHGLPELETTLEKADSTQSCDVYRHLRHGRGDNTRH